MAGRTRAGQDQQALGVIWTIPDELWLRIEPILLAYWPPKATGRKVADWRRALDGIVFRMRTGCQWDQLPERFGPKSTVHDWFGRWSRAGVMARIMARIMAVLIEECEGLGEVHWQWQLAVATGSGRRPTA